MPYVVFGKNVKPGNYGTRKTFADMGATVLNYLGINESLDGTPLDIFV